MEQTSKLAGLVRRLQQFLLVREIRIAVSAFRYVLYALILRRVRRFSGDDRNLGANTLDYNFKKIGKSLHVDNRIHMLARPVTAISYVATQLPFAKTLSIGPRAEGELLALAGYGFSWSNIHGLDLFSYSPRIDVGDMHAMPYPDSSFDVIVCGWTLGYSDNRPKALAEMVRVLKPGGILAIGESYHSKTYEEGAVYHGYELGSRDRINQLDEIVAPIKDNILNWYFRQEATEEDYRREITAIVGVFSIKK
ncbi:class I SAM-dependent methyltransferase [Ferrovibrio sp.]|uniref:class I SAM-dependent methyltransferase n=1 Tax=Ferrovibrio sp. TaxID=1917215 RepID=UPI0026348D9F|nr:class I SAM-dependent methyltransferase [Ferrovibrio sp.]